MTESEDSSLSKQAIEDYLKNYLQENDYPDGPFELLDLAKVQYQIDVWKWVIIFDLTKIVSETEPCHQNIG